MVSFSASCQLRRGSDEVLSEMIQRSASERRSPQKELRGDDWKDQGYLINVFVQDLTAEMFQIRRHRVSS